MFKSLTDKKRQLDAYRPLSPDLLNNLQEWFRIELTFTSNAIEGNTLTRRETAMVVEKGLTVGGKTLTEHLEAKNHADAFDWMMSQVSRKPHQLTASDILHLHGLVLKGIDDSNAGQCRSVAVRVSGSNVIFPNPRKVPDLLEDLGKWLAEKPKLHPVELAAETHYRLVNIHPFVDGNGRTARLLMNLILLMKGYPAAIIRKQDRLKYITALETAQLGGPLDDYYKLISKSVDRSLDIYLNAISGEDNSTPLDTETLLKIGQLAKQSQVANSTIRHWTKQGLIDVAEITTTGYQMYSPDTLKRIEQIKTLKSQRLTLEEIKEKLD